MRDEMVIALKGGEKVRLSTLRLLAAAVKNREVELGHELSDEEFVEVAMKEVKRRREAIEAYEKAGRQGHGGGGARRPGKGHGAGHGGRQGPGRRQGGAGTGPGAPGRLNRPPSI